MLVLQVEALTPLQLSKAAPRKAILRYSELTENEQENATVGGEAPIRYLL